VSRPLARTVDVMPPGELDSSALKGSVAFTGRLACMSRAEAFEVVRQYGGTPSQAVTKRTTLLIVGELGWPLLDDGRPSNKLSGATTYGIPVVSERRFLEWIGKAVPDSVQKTYSGEQLAALSKLSGEAIQELTQFGLLDERGGRFGFRDLASARQIAKLLADGVRLSEIVRGVSEIRRWLPEVGLSNVRLRPGPGNTIEVEQPGGRTDKRGQFLFAVDVSEESPDDLFARARSAEEMGDIVEAERLYRLANKKRSSGCIGAVQSRKYAPDRWPLCRSGSRFKNSDASRSGVCPGLVQSW
jgi:BRCA1 C Terminus (BRCT) domain